MKKIILTVTAIIATSTMAFAGTNFNTLIDENSKAQNELHAQIKSTVDDVKMAVIDGNKTISVAGETIHVKTDKNFLTFSKEKKYFKPSETRAQKRLAEEFQNLE